jgi:hypothetical protein
MALRLSGLEINVGPVSVSATATALQITTIHCTFQEPSLMTQTLSQLENRGAFIERHIGPDAQQQQEMLKTVGADSLNALIGQIVPNAASGGEATTDSPRWRS